MRDNDPLTRGNMQTLMDFIRQENRRLDNRLGDKIDNLDKKIDRVDKKIDTVKADLEQKIDTLDKKVDTVKADLEQKIDTLDKKVDVLTDAVIEGFDNTERILSDWEGKPVTLISKQTKDELENTA